MTAENEGLCAACRPNRKAGGVCSRKGAQNAATLVHEGGRAPGPCALGIRARMGEDTRTEGTDCLSCGRSQVAAASSVDQSLGADDQIPIGVSSPGVVSGMGASRMQIRISCRAWNDCCRLLPPPTISNSFGSCPSSPGSWRRSQNSSTLYSIRRFYSYR